MKNAVGFIARESIVYIRLKTRQLCPKLRLDEIMTSTYEAVASRNLS